MKILFFFCLLVYGSIAYAQHVVGTPFPEMETQMVHDTVIMLPRDVQDKYTLLGLAYSKKAEKDLKTWFNPVYNKFIKGASGIFASFSYDINVFFVPMFTGLKAAATGAAKKKVANQLDPLLKDHILFYKGDLKPYKKALEFDKKDVPYLFLIDREGKIVYATSGAYSGRKSEAIENFLNSL